MATLDILQYYGGKPANFLDAGGGAGSETMARAIELLLEKKPRVIFINIFGGITRCDDVANAITQVLGQQKIEIPVVIRLVGTNEEEGRRILEAQSLSAYNLMHEAAQKAVELARK
jgi:succinyl-CoA synthetase beta subunit